MRALLLTVLIGAGGCVAQMDDDHSSELGEISAPLEDADACPDKSSPLAGLCAGNTVCRTGPLQYVPPDANGNCPRGSRPITVSKKNMRALGYLMAGAPPACDNGCRPVRGKNGEEVELRRFEFSMPFGRSCGFYWKTRQCEPDPAADAGAEPADASVPPN